MHVRLDDASDHADRIVDHHVVVVKRIALDHMRDQTIVLALPLDLGIKGHGQARDSLDGSAVDFGVGQHHLPHLVDAVKVFAGQRHRNRGHLTPRRLLGFCNGRANRFHGKLHILHAAVLDAKRGDLAKPQKREFSAFGSVGHGHRNLFRTDVERGDG